LVMKRVLLATAVLACASTAHANGVQDAMKKIGPAYMCGANFEYTAALDNLRSELLNAGLSASMADAALVDVRKTAEANAEARQKITAEDCATKYGRPIN
jgi:membrane-bound lytic murein transglycosylase B